MLRHACYSQQTSHTENRLGGCPLPPPPLFLYVYVCGSVCAGVCMAIFTPTLFFLVLRFFFTRDCSKVLVWQFCFSVRSFRLFFFFFSNFYSSFVSAASASSFSLLPCVSQCVSVCVGDFCFCLLVLCFVSSVSARHQRQFH